MRVRVGHILSRCLLYPIIYYIVGYRKKVVRENLNLAFPETAEKERRAIERKFYLYFSDMVIETLIGRNFDTTIMRHFVHLYEEKSMQEHCAEYGGCFVIMGHFMNWEWTSSLAIPLTDDGKQFGIVYKQLSSTFFDRLMQQFRAKKGGFLIEMNQLLRVMIHQKNDPTVSATYYAMLADQRPGKAGKIKQYETLLLGQPVGMLTGTEQLARKFSYPIYYAYLIADKRGYYNATFMPIYNPEVDQEKPIGTATERFTRLLEKNIQEQPERWLWTHRRFLHSRK